MRGKEDKCNAFLALYLCEAEFCDGTGNQQSEDSALLSSAGYRLVCIISRSATSLYLFFHYFFHHYKQLFSNWMFIVVSKALFWCLEWYQWCLEWFLLDILKFIWWSGWLWNGWSLPIQVVYSYVLLILATKLVKYLVSTFHSSWVQITWGFFSWWFVL